MKIVNIPTIWYHLTLIYTFSIKICKNSIIFRKISILYKWRLRYILRAFKFIQVSRSLDNLIENALLLLMLNKYYNKTLTRRNEKSFLDLRGITR